MNVSGKVAKTHITPDDLIGKRKGRPLPQGNVEPRPEEQQSEVGLRYIAMLNATLGGTDARE
jgi:hypothetical protein